ncbi:MAG: HAD family hydrolase [Traorella sp.]
MKGFIFDLDGTLLDSLGLWLEIDKKYMATYNIEYKKEYSDDIKKLSFKECATYFRETLGINRSEKEMIQDWKEMSYEAYKNELTLKPYAYEFVRKVHQYGPCILATSCEINSCLAALDRLGLSSYFDAIVTTDELKVNKENPLIYLECAKRIKCEIDDCYVFEDVLSACKSAFRAHFHVIGVYDEMWLDDKEEMMKVCDRYIYSFKELLDEMC